jgi:hypothetical protein
MVVVLFHHHPTPIVHPHNDTDDDELAGPLLLPEQIISLRIHVNIRYFKIPQYRTGYQLVLEEKCSKKKINGKNTASSYAAIVLPYLESHMLYGETKQRCARLTLVSLYTIKGDTPTFITKRRRTPSNPCLHLLA